MNKSVIEIAKTVIKTEAEAILELKNRINENFEGVCHLLANCKGKVILTGMGKSGHIARKISATLSSTGTSSFFINAADASHGDLGMISPTDIILAMSYSGETQELISILPSLKKMKLGAQLLLMTLFV